MSINELKAKAEELKDLKVMRAELDNEITALEDEIKAHMGEREQITTTRRFSII